MSAFGIEPDSDEVWELMQVHGCPVLQLSTRRIHRVHGQSIPSVHGVALTREGFRIYRRPGRIHQSFPFCSSCWRVPREPPKEFEPPPMGTPVWVPSPYRGAGPTRAVYLGAYSKPGMRGMHQVRTAYGKLRPVKATDIALVAPGEPTR